MYRENPKTAGSGIECAISQVGRCPRGCADCFYQSGRSYLEPLAENLPNMPPPADYLRVVRFNDGNDSAHNWSEVKEAGAQYPMRFYNTAASPEEFLAIDWDAPVVWTVNPGERTDLGPYLIEPLPWLMFIRVRMNTWNIEQVVEPAIRHYIEVYRVPVILTFMAYHDVEAIPHDHQICYMRRKRTVNDYWAITPWAWTSVMQRYYDNPFVYSCGRVEGVEDGTKCRRCGNCLREYFATMERVRIGAAR